MVAYVTGGDQAFADCKPRSRAVGHAAAARPSSQVSVLSRGQVNCS